MSDQDDIAVTNAVAARADNPLWNADLAPVDAEHRTWNWLNIASLWVGMVVCVPTYMLAAGLIDQGMSVYQAIATVFLGNLIVLVPMLLIGHAGTKYGIPFPVLLRASFGTVGAMLPAILRGLVACGWFGIQTWIGGLAIYTVLNILTNGALVGDALPLIGIDPAQTLCFLAFWAIQLIFIHYGTESLKWLETIAAPFLLLMGLALLGWAYMAAGGFGPIMDQPSQFVSGGLREGQFWLVFWPGLTAMVGFWATLSLNIPDFTRFAKSQRDQITGQAIGLPIPMALFAFIGAAVASATVLVYGETIWNPVDLAGQFGGVVAVIALIVLVLATLTTNLAANVVAPANGFSNLAPRRINFRMGGYITAGLGIAIMPWKLLETSGGYIFTWLIGYSSLLGPIAGILIVDYFILRRQKLIEADLFDVNGSYRYKCGWNIWALVAFILAVLPNVPGFLVTGSFIAEDAVPAFFIEIYSHAWFVGAIAAAVIYGALMALCPQGCGRCFCSASKPDGEAEKT